VWNPEIPCIWNLCLSCFSVTTVLAGPYNIEKKVDSDAEDEDEDDDEGFGGGAKKKEEEDDPVLQAKAMAEAQMANVKQQAEKCVVQ